MWGRRPGRPGGCDPPSCGARPGPSGVPGGRETQPGEGGSHVNITVRGRHTEVNDRFRRHVDNKLARIERLNQKVIRVDVEVSEERNPRLADQRERVEL